MRKLILIVMIVVGAISCDKQDRENTYIKQEENIDRYLSSLSDTYRIARNNNSNRVVIQEGSSSLDSLQVGDSLCFFFSGYIFSSARGALFTTNVGEIARMYNITTSDTLVKRIHFTKDQLISGLFNGLQNVRKGEHCYVVFSAKYGYGNTTMFNVPKQTALFFDITVEDIIKN